MEKMESQIGSERTSIRDYLLSNPYEFDFFQAVNILIQSLPEKDKKMDIGRTRFYFQSNIRMDFPASDMEKISVNEEGRVQILTNFLGLAGVNGPLPYVYAELILKRLNKKDRALKDFLDIFNHRLVLLLYDLKKKYSIPFGYESPEKNRFSGILLSLSGLGTGFLRNRLHLSDRSLLFYTAFFSNERRTSSNLIQMISHCFNVSVDILSFMGEWYSFDEDQYTILGLHGRNRVLGRDTVLGKRVWLQDRKIRIVIGPVSYKKYLEFLPNGSAFQSINELVKFFLKDELDYDFKFIIDGGTIPVLTLNSRTRLGWNSILTGSDKKDCETYGKSLGEKI